jgi:hypothetical protein
MKDLVSLIVMLFLFCSSTTNAQSVLGIAFGSSYETVKSALVQRYGAGSVEDDNGVLKIYQNVNVGDYAFDYAHFDFQRQGSKSYFYFAHFEAHFPLGSSKEAIANRDYLFNLLKGKYMSDYVDSYINDQGYKCYKFGTNPRNNDMPLGYITLSKSVGNDRKERLYLDLEYGPIYYIDKSADF